MSGSETKQLRRKLQEAQQLIDNCNQDNADLEDQLLKSKNQPKAVVVANAALQNQVKEYENYLTLAAEQAQESARENARLNATIIGLKETIAALNNSIDSLQDELAQPQPNVIVNSEKRDDSRQVAELNTIIDQLKLQLQSQPVPSAIAAASNDAEVELLKERLAEAQGTNQELQERIQSVENLGSFDEELKDNVLESELKVKNEELQAKTLELNQCMSSLATAQQQLAALNQSLAQTQSGDKRQQTVIQSQQQEISQTLIQVADLQRQLQAERATYNSEIQKRNAEVSMLTQTYTNLMQTKEALELKQKALQAETAEKQRQFDSFNIGAPLPPTIVERGIGWFKGLTGTKSGGRKMYTRKRLGRRGRQGMRTRKYRRR